MGSVQCFFSLVFLFYFIYCLIQVLKNQEVFSIQLITQSKNVCFPFLLPVTDACDTCFNSKLSPDSRRFGFHDFIHFPISPSFIYPVCPSTYPYLFIHLSIHPSVTSIIHLPIRPSPIHHKQFEHLFQANPTLNNSLGCFQGATMFHLPPFRLYLLMRNLHVSHAMLTHHLGKLCHLHF